MTEQVLTPPEGALEINYPCSDVILVTVIDCIKGKTPSAYGVTRKVWLEVIEDAITCMSDTNRALVALAHLGFSECSPCLGRQSTESEIIQFAQSQIDNAIEANWTTDLIEWGLI